MSEYDPQLEQDIIWLDASAKQRPYLRQIIHKFSSRTRAPGKAYKLFLAYATLRPEARSQNNRFERRVWYVLAHDPYSSGFPTQAVDTESIVVGQPARRGRRDEP